MHKLNYNTLIRSLVAQSFQGGLQVFHTSPNRIEGLSEDHLFSGCLFFSPGLYEMSNSSFIYMLDLNESEVLDRSDLDDSETISEIMNNFDVDEDDALSLLDGSLSVWNLEGDYDSAYVDWTLQGYAGVSAHRDGYKACRDTDEQGTVYIAYLVGKEDLLISINDLVVNKLSDYDLSMFEDVETAIEQALDDLGIDVGFSKGFVDEVSSRI